MTDSKKIIVALDYSDAESALAMVKRLDPTKCRVKVGKELFTRVGPSIVERCQNLGFELFLDLKFHDIPNTTAQAVKAAAEMGVWMVNVHAGGGRRMMEQAREVLEQVPGQRTHLIAVTVLTSMQREDLKEIGLDVDPLVQVKRLAALTHSCGLSGIVCSAQEAAELRKSLDPSFLLVTPGIRPADSSAGDQQRIMTPKAALEAGSSYLVIGRPITKSDDPLASLAKIEKEISTFYQ